MHHAVWMWQGYFLSQQQRRIKWLLPYESAWSYSFGCWTNIDCNLSVSFVHMDSWWLSLGSMDKTNHGHFHACHPHCTVTQWLVSQFSVLHKQLSTVRPQNLLWPSGIPSQRNKTIAFDEFWYSCTHDSSRSNDLSTIEWNAFSHSPWPKDW